MNKTSIKAAIAAATPENSSGSRRRHLTLAAAFLNNTAYAEAESSTAHAGPAKDYLLEEYLKPCFPADEKVLLAVRAWLAERTSCRHTLLPETVPERFRPEYIEWAHSATQVA